MSHPTAEPVSAGGEISEYRPGQIFQFLDGAQVRIISLTPDLDSDETILVLEWLSPSGLIADMSLSEFRAQNPTLVGEGV